MSCNIGRVDLCFRHGDTADAWSMEFLDNEKNVMALTGYEFFLEVRKNDVKVKLLTIGSGLTINGNKLIIDKKAKESLPNDVYDYALKMKEPDGDLYTFLNGKITIEKELVDEDA